MNTFWKKVSAAILFLVLFLPSLSMDLYAQTATVEQRIISSGYKYLGVPYQWGASPHQTSTFDCSSYTQRVFAENGITIPRTSSLQFELGTRIPLSAAKAGDLVFFNDGQANVVSHVGIYMGNMQMLSATVSKGTRVVDISTSYWMSRFISAKYVLPQTHKVTEHDSLWKISRSTGHSIEELKKWNRLTSDMILTGEFLFISNPNLIDLAKERKYHIVQPTDSLWTLSQKYGVTIQQLQQWNQITNANMIYDGTRIYVE